MTTERRGAITGFVILFLAATWCGGAAGPAFISREGHPTSSCNTAFCNLPDASWQITPTLKIQIPVLSSVKLMGGGRAHLYTEDKSATFPFKSGVVFFMGLEVS